MHALFKIGRCPVPESWTPGAARYQKVGHRALPGTRKLDIRRCPVPESCIITTALVDGEKDNTMEVAIFEFEVMLEFIENKI